MTKKHFIALAKTLNELRIRGLNRGEQVTFTEIVIAIADVCASFNSNFDRDRFYAEVNKHAA